MTMQTIAGRLTTLAPAQAMGFEASDKTQVRVWKEQTEFVPVRKSNYKFQREKLSFLNAHMLYGNQQGLWIWGLHGTGKTSMIEQYCAMTRTEVFGLNGTSRTEATDFIGCYQLTTQHLEGVDNPQPEMVWVDGPLIQAMRRGGVFLVNEIDVVDPGELAALHDVLEGKSIHLPTGEVVQPEETFRVIATANTPGYGDESGAYAGTQGMNAAFMDRFLVIRVEYLEKDHEAELLMGTAPVLGETLIEKMVDFANQVRRQYAGPHNDGSGDLGVTIGHRSMIMWAKMAELMQGSKSPLKSALQAVVLEKSPRIDREVVERLFDAHFGNSI